MRDSYLLGIDVGTSVVKSVLFDVQGREVVVARRESQVLRPRPNWSEADMELMWALTLDTLREVAADGRGDAVLGIGITGTCCGAWLVDAHGSPVRTAILWNDGRAADILEEWQRTDLFRSIFAISGNALFPGYTLPVLAWLQRNEPETLASARWLLNSKDWIRFKLTGEIAGEESDCSYLPFDIRRRALSPELFSLAGIDDHLRLIPRLQQGFDAAGAVTPAVAAATGLRAGTLVAAGLVDVVASTLGAGAWRPGQACSIVGTSMLNSLVSASPMFEPAGIGVQAVMPDGAWLRSLVNTSGTLNLDWMLGVLADEEKRAAAARAISVFDLVEALIEQIPIGAEGVMYHPYINTAGVVSPFVNPTARAQFFGIGVHHTRAHLIRAVYEGVALAMLDAYENMPQPCEEVLLSGGGARSTFWSQMFADAMGRSVLVAAGSEFGARGAAMMAGIGAGVYRDLGEAAATVQIARRHKPDLAAHLRYRALYELYRAIYQQLQDAWWLRHRVLQQIAEMP